MVVVRRDEPGVLVDAHAADCRPAPGEALVRLIRAGVTPADAAAAQGILPHQGVLGRRYVGVVERVNASPAEAASWQGKRVTANAERVCGECASCRSGLSRNCPARTVRGLGGEPGCFAARFVVPVTQLIEPPGEMSDEAVLLAEDAASAAHVLRLAALDRRPYVTVLGDSAPALILARVASGRNAAVRLLGRDPESLEACARWGVRHRPAAEAGRRADQDVVIDARADAESLRMAVDLLRPRGTLIVLHPLGVAPTRHIGPRGTAAFDSGVLARLASAEVTLVGAGAGRVSEGLESIARGGVDVSGLPARRFRLADAADALRCAGTSSAVVTLEP